MRDPGERLFDAAAAGTPGDVVKALKDGANPNWIGPRGTPLHEASRFGNTKNVALLLEAGADARITRGSGSTALHLAAQRGYAEIAVLLIAHGAKHGAADRSGWTPLHHAMGARKEGMAELLLDAGADINVPNIDGHTPVDAARECGHGDLADKMMARYESIQLSQVAAPPATSGPARRRI